MNSPTRSQRLAQKEMEIGEFCANARIRTYEGPRLRYDSLLDYGLGASTSIAHDRYDIDLDNCIAKGCFKRDQIGITPKGVQAGR